jgi:hypothetical protein
MLNGDEAENCPSAYQRLLCLRFAKGSHSAKALATVSQNKSPQARLPLAEEFKKIKHGIDIVRVVLVEYPVLFQVSKDSISVIVPPNAFFIAKTTIQY